jgi:sphingomyelin phosphodiesterase acid-like 3
VNDLFLSPKYRSCAGKADDSAGAAELVWIRQQLAQARAAGERVWVMGHIPPGIDPYSTLMSFSNVCDGGDPVLFLAEDKLADLMVEYADVVRLGIFAHTHMDEMRVLTREGDGAQGGVAIKIVPSISPVDGNEPSFTIARVNAASSVMEDYQVVSTGYEAGIAAGWAQTYDFHPTYDQARFTPAAVEAVIAEFKADRGATGKASQAYLRHYFAGDRAAELRIFWTQYVCALNNYSAKGYAACVCGGTKQPAATAP